MDLVTAFLGFLSLLCPWVGAVVDLGQVLKVEVGIDLGGADICMSQQLLYRPQVTGGFEQMPGEGVAQHVWVNVLSGPLFYRPLLQPLLNGTGADTSTVPADKEGGFTRLCQFSTYLLPGSDRMQCFFPHRQLPALSPFTGHRQAGIGAVDLADIDGDQLRQSQTEE